MQQFSPHHTTHSFTDNNDDNAHMYTEEQQRVILNSLQVQANINGKRSMMST